MGTNKDYILDLQTTPSDAVQIRIDNVLYPTTDIEAWDLGTWARYKRMQREYAEIEKSLAEYEPTSEEYRDASVEAFILLVDICLCIVPTVPRAILEKLTPAKAYQIIELFTKRPLPDNGTAVVAVKNGSTPARKHR